MSVGGTVYISAFSMQILEVFEALAEPTAARL